MKNMKTYRDDKGRKLYPVCGFQKNQHKFDYWHTKALNRWYDDHSDKNYDELEKTESWMLCATTYIFNGLIYAPWEHYNEMKEAIVAYDLNH